MQKMFLDLWLKKIFSTSIETKKSEILTKLKKIFPRGNNCHRPQRTLAIHQRMDMDDLDLFVVRQIHHQSLVYPKDRPQFAQIRAL